jgi:hypothetical protein
MLAALRKRRRRDPPDLKPEIGDFCLPAPARTRAMLDRAIKLACHSNDWSARAFAHPTNVIQFHRDLL